MAHDHEVDRAALMVRASDASMTPGEKAAHEEAARRAASPSAEVRATTQEWLDLAPKARA